MTEKVLPNKMAIWGFASTKVPIGQLPLLCDQYGNLRTVAGSSGSGSAGAIELNADGELATLYGAAGAAFMFGFNGASWDRLRIANTFKTVNVTAAGSTAVWTPGAGNFFRLMGYTISVSGTVAAAGEQVIELLDGAATVISQHNATVQVVITGDTQIGADLGQGYLSVAAANVLNVHLGTAMATGSVAVNVWGTQGPTA
jgi:hypothetical protein